jgi:hypothetical protein
MSKTITIPSCKNPFVITVNNHTYSYKAGETVEVPDWVAEVIENHVDSVPKAKRFLSKFAQLVEGNIEGMSMDDLKGITAISPHAFYNITGLKNITIPNSVLSIGGWAFFSCPDLEAVRFEDNSHINNIETNAFVWCTKLSKVYLPEKPPTLADVNAFDSIKADCVFYCKSQASLDAYRAAPNWSTVAGTYSFVVEE